MTFWDQCFLQIYCCAISKNCNCFLFSVYLQNYWLHASTNMKKKTFPRSCQVCDDKCLFFLQTLILIVPCCQAASIKWLSPLSLSDLWKREEQYFHLTMLPLSCWGDIASWIETKTNSRHCSYLLWSLIFIKNYTS